MFGKAAYLCKDFDTSVRFLTGITDAPDFEKLGEDVFDTYTRIFAIYRASQDIEKLEQYKEKLTEFGKLHGKNIIFE